MTTAEALLADLRSRGVDLETDGVRLRWRPAFLVTARQAESIRAGREGLIELLAGPDRLPRCPTCTWPLDSARRCPKCFDRLCVGCGRPTGSYFVLRCIACGHAFEKEAVHEPVPVVEPANEGSTVQGPGSGRG
jgi:hypothetical protein